MGPEASQTFDCFGSRCAVHVGGGASAASATGAAQDVRAALLAWHGRFSRFLPESELSALNRDPRPTVPASPLMVRLAQATYEAGLLTSGLVDATLLGQIEDAGYASDLPAAGLSLADALALAPPRRRALARREGSWRSVAADAAAGTVTRPPGVRLDSGGLAKGLFADVLAAGLADHESFAVDCAGDLSLGGRGGLARAVEVESPFDGRTLHTFELCEGGVATSGIGRRSWLDAAGRPAHHLLDPATGRPAFTGIVQATALAPSALLAEVRAKAAVLSGPERAPRWLAHGGVLVFEDGSHRVIDAQPRLTAAALTRYRTPARSSRAPAVASA